MQKLVITGGVALEGEIKASGAKNAALPLLACALLTDEPMTFVNVPDLADVHTMLKLLEELGCKVTQEGHKVTIGASHITSTEAPYDLVKTMRASILVLGPLLARFGKAKVSLPGGCSIGARPVDQHIKGLKALGADISIEHGYVTAHADKLVGTNIVTDMVTVTGTENLLMAAVLAEGTTVLANAARVKRGARLRIATKYMKYSRDYYARVGVHVDLIKLYGSMELAPISGLSDAIVDLVSTGATLKANNLVEVETVDYISSRLIVGSTAMKLKRQELLPLIEIFANTVKKE